MAKSTSSFASFAALLMVTAAVAQLMPPTTNERAKDELDRDNSGQESSSEDSRDLSLYLRQLLRERNSIPDSENSKTDEEEEMRRRGAILLMRLLTKDDQDNSTPDKKKRTCKVNLGGNCATEEALSMADHWHFLNSALSPGRRRRSAGDRSSLSQEKQEQRRRIVKD